MLPSSSLLSAYGLWNTTIMVAFRACVVVQINVSSHVISAFNGAVAGQVYIRANNRSMQARRLPFDTIYLVSLCSHAEHRGLP